MNASVITNILRSILMIGGTYLATKFGGDAELLNKAVDAIATNGAILAAVGAAIWSFLRSLKRAKAGVK